MSPTDTLEQSEKATRKPLLTRRRFLQLASYSSVGLAVYAGEIERHEIDEVRQTVFLRNLPEAFAGFTIAQLSDIHLDEYTEPFFLEDAVRRINAMGPDLVALTGDYVSFEPLPARYPARFSQHCGRLLSALTCPLRYAVLGNHDATVSVPAVTEALEHYGMPLLANRSVPLERGNARLWLAGVRDVLMERADLDLALPRAAGPNEPVILLAHEGDFADAIGHRRVDLMLSGHTHGGQVRIPFMRPFMLPGLGEKYVQGLFQIGATQLYVNRGLGTVGVPFRFRCRPEITLFTLQRA